MKPMVLAAGLLLAGCARPLIPTLPPSAPADPIERRRAEVGACQSNGLPPWLDDAALQAAMGADQREAYASTANESFRGATYTPQPPITARTGPRTAAMLRDRDEFQQWCAAVRASRRPAP